MDAGTAKIRIKFGNLEVDYEGDSTFLRDGLANTLGTMAEFWRDHGEAFTPPEPESTRLQTDSSPAMEPLSTTTIALKMGVKTGADLALAAAARLQIFEGKSKFTRHEIHQEMKAATTYYNKNQGSNLSSYLDTMVKAQRLNQVSKDTYAITAPELDALRAKLA